MHPDKLNNKYLLQVINLKKNYIKKNFFNKNNILRVLSGISFKLKPSQTLAIVGESGCGKTTLVRLLTMIEKADAGDIYWKNKYLFANNRYFQKLYRQKVQVVFQNPYSSLNPCKKIYQILEEPLIINTLLNKVERREKIIEILNQVGLKNEDYSRYPHMFSGGQCQRIAIARGLMLQPDLLIADEPVSALDVLIQAQILNLMIDLQQKIGLSYIFISHNLSVVKHIADEVMVIYLGHCVEIGNKNNIFKNPKHPYTKALLSAIPNLASDLELKKIKLQGELPSLMDFPTGCVFSTRCYCRLDICSKYKPELKTYNQTEHKVACFAIEQNKK
ncbi:MAG: dipeptide ABC transporter ATP-binding protein [Pantoea sp. Brub]|nr:dipeptide ABC transporter ATP-binding protein [Pantoea sp. Brub]